MCRWEHFHDCLLVRRAVKKGFTPWARARWVLKALADPSEDGLGTVAVLRQNPPQGLGTEEGQVGRARAKAAAGSIAIAAPALNASRATASSVKQASAYAASMLEDDDDEEEEADWYKQHDGLMVCTSAVRAVFTVGTLSIRGCVFRVVRESLHARAVVAIYSHATAVPHLVSVVSWVCWGQVGRIIRSQSIPAPHAHHHKDGGQNFYNRCLVSYKNTRLQVFPYQVFPSVHVECLLQNIFCSSHVLTESKN